MPFIGNKPTAVPLSGDDIQDGTITSADLQSGVIKNQSAFKNIIINGDMSIAQRGTSTASITGSGYHTVDRFETICSLGTWTQSQSTDVPSGQGFAKSLKMDCTTANASPATAETIRVRQSIEGQNLQYLKKGTTNAESVTLSFWVKSNKTGTYIAELFDEDNARQISKSYTVDSASTWEKKTLTFAGDISGALGNDNGASIVLTFWLGTGTQFSSGTLATSWEAQTNANRAVGQVNLADSTDNEWYITGIQLEAGETASDFEFLPYDVNLIRCARYCYAFGEGSGDVQGNRFYSARYSSGASFISIDLPVRMRTEPSQTFTQSGGASDADYSTPERVSVYDSDVTDWRIYDVLAEAEL